jgi:hypothetical protein
MTSWTTQELEAVEAQVTKLLSDERTSEARLIALAIREAGLRIQIALQATR